MMNFETDHIEVIRNFLRGAEEQVFEYVYRELGECLGDDTPDSEVVRSYLFCPERDTGLNVQERLMAMDKLLEYAEVSFRTVCDLIRYKMFREAGVVHSMDEFLELFRSEEDS